MAISVPNLISTDISSYEPINADPTGLTRRAGSMFGSSPAAKQVSNQMDTYREGEIGTKTDPSTGVTTPTTYMSGPTAASMTATQKTVDFIKSLPDWLKKQAELGNVSIPAPVVPAAPDISAPLAPATAATIDPSAVAPAFQIAPIAPTETLGQAGAVTPNWLSAQAAQIGATPQMQAAQIGYVAPMQAASIADTNLAQANQARDFQTALAAQLQQQAMGQGPSLAAEQLRQGLSRNIAASQAQAASLRGNASPLAARQVLQTAAQQRGDVANQAALARMAEQQAAQQQLGAVSQQLRGQDVATADMLQRLAAARAGLTQEAGLANMQAAQQRALQQAAFQQQAGLANVENAQQRAMAQAQFNQQTALANADRRLQFANQEIGRQLEMSRLGLQQQVAQGQLSNEQADRLFKVAVQNTANQQQVNLANQAQDQFMRQQLLQKYGIESDVAMRTYLAQLQAQAADRLARGQQTAAAAGFITSLAQTGATAYGGPAAGVAAGYGANRLVNNTAYQTDPYGRIEVSGPEGSQMIPVEDVPEAQG